MTKSIDINFLELLSSKICHDLISPIGAINNGLELMADMGPEAGPEAAELIAFSANLASAKLQAFRLAYGAGGADSTIKLADVHKAIQQIVGLEKKITQNWDPQSKLPLADQKGFNKILTCTLLVAMESLPKGGKLLVLQNGDAVSVKAEGNDAGLRSPGPDALKLAIPLDKLEPKDVHACMTGLLAKHYGFNVSAETPAPGSAEFRISQV